MEKRFLKDGEMQQLDAGRALHVHTFYPGERILAENSQPGCFFVILSGQVQTIYRCGKTILLKEHDIFGLQHVLFGKPSLYTAVAADESRIATYGQHALDHFVRENPRMTKNIMKSVMRQFVDVVQHRTQDQEETFALEDYDVIFLQDGERVIEEGTTGRDFYRLVSTEGGLRVSIRGLEVNRIDKPGEFFGEMAGLLNLPRQATITSIGQSVVEVYANDKLEIFIRDYPETALRLMRMLVSRLAAMNRRYQGDNS